MEHSNRTGLQNSGTEARLRQVLSHLHIESLDEPACQVCEDRLTASEQITLYLYKPAGTSRYSVGQYRCHSHDDNLSTLFTLGVRELIVEGRIGQHRGPTTETSPVLLTPSIRLISASDTTTGRVPTETDEPDEPWSHGEHLQDRLPTTQTELTVGAGQ